MLRRNHPTSAKGVASTCRSARAFFMEAVPLNATTTVLAPQPMRQRVSCSISQKLWELDMPYRLRAVSRVRVVLAVKEGPSGFPCWGFWGPCWWGCWGRCRGGCCSLDVFLSPFRGASGSCSNTHVFVFVLKLTLVSPLMWCLQNVCLLSFLIMLANMVTVQEHMTGDIYNTDDMYTLKTHSKTQQYGGAGKV